MNTSQEDSLPFHGRIHAGVGEGSEAQHSEDLGKLDEGTFEGICLTVNAYDNFDFNSNKGSSAFVWRPLTPELTNVSRFLAQEILMVA